MSHEEILLFFYKYCSLHRPALAYLATRDDYISQFIKLDNYRETFNIKFATGFRNKSSYYSIWIFHIQSVYFYFKSICSLIYTPLVGNALILSLYSSPIKEKNSLFIGNPILFCYLNSKLPTINGTK